MEERVVKSLLIADHFHVTKQRFDSLALIRVHRWVQCVERNVLPRRLQ